MGNSASVSTAPSPPSSSSSTVGLNASQHQQLREAVALAEPDYIATIMQLIDDEGIVWDSPNATERGEAQIRAFQLLCPGVPVIPLTPGQPAHAPVFGPGPPSSTEEDETDDDDDDDDDPFAGMPALVDTSAAGAAGIRYGEQQATTSGGGAGGGDPYEGMPALITAREVEAERETKRKKTEEGKEQEEEDNHPDHPDPGDMTDEERPSVLPAGQTGPSSAGATGMSATSSPNSDEEMPGLLGPTVAAELSDDDEMPALLDPTAARTRPLPTAAAADDSDDSDSMPSLISTHLTRSFTTPPAPAPAPPPPPSAFSSFHFSPSFTPSLLPSHTFALPSLPSPDDSPLRRSLASLPVDILHAIGWYLREEPTRDTHGFIAMRHCKISLIRLSGTCRVWYDVLRRHMWRYIEIRGDKATKEMMEWLKGNEEVASWVKYVEVSTLCPDHLALVRPTADALAVFTNLVHFSWQVRALVPPSIAASLAKSTTLTSLHLWAHSIHSAYLLGNLSLTELRVARSKHGADAQCDKLLDAAYLPLTDGTAEENEVVYQMRDKRDLSAYRGLIESNHTTLERLCIEPDLRSLLWMETVFGKPAELDRVDHNAIANGAAPAPPIFSPGEQCLPFLALPRLKNVQFTLADLTSPSWTHLLATSPELESMCIEHLPEDEGNEISPGAPEGSLKKLKALHYRGGRMEGQIEPFPLREGFENFLGAGGQETKVEDLEISYMSASDFAGLLTSRDFSALTRLTVALSSPLTRNLMSLLIKEAPLLNDLAIKAPQYAFTLTVFSTMLTRLKNLTHLTTDHPAALQSERHPIPMAADLIMSGVYPSDISGKLEKYMNDHKARWTKVFTRLAQENPKLETIEWQASDEISYNWLITTAPSLPLSPTPLSPEAQAIADALPFPPSKGPPKREVSMDPEGRVELGPFHPSSLEALLGAGAGFPMNLDGAALLDLLGGQIQFMPAGGPGGGQMPGGWGGPGGAGDAGGGGAGAAGGGGNGAGGLAGLMGGLFGGFGLGGGGAGAGAGGAGGGGGGGGGP